MYLLIFTPQEKTLYSLKGEALEKRTNEHLFAWERLLNKRILLLSKEYVYHLLLRFPPLKRGDLEKAIINELPSLSDLRKAEFTYVVRSSGELFTEVELFLWDGLTLEAIKKSYSFTHVIPEELLFLFPEKTLSIHIRANAALFVLSDRGQYLGSLFLKLPLDQFLIKNFLRECKTEISQLKKIKIFGSIEALAPLRDLFQEKLEFYGSLERNLPYLIKNTPLNQFRIKKEITLGINRLFMPLKVTLIILLGLNAQSLFSVLEYEKKSSHLKEETQRLEQKLIKLKLTENRTTYDLEEERRLAAKEIIQEFQALHKGHRYSSFYILNELSRVLPEGSNIVNLSLRGNQLNILMDSRDLLDTIKAIKNSTIVSNIKITDPPIHDPRANKYRFRLEVTLK